MAPVAEASGCKVCKQPVDAAHQVEGAKFACHGACFRCVRSQPPITCRGFEHHSSDSLASPRPSLLYVRWRIRVKRFTWPSVASLGRCSRCKGALQLDSHWSVNGVLYCSRDFGKEYQLFTLQNGDDEEDEEEGELCAPGDWLAWKTHCMAAR